MKFNFAHITPLMILLVSFHTALSDRKNTIENPNSYFPVNDNITLVYE